jgi:hypothetical protein
MPAKDDHEMFSQLADRIFGDDEDKKRDYVDWHMKNLGYRASVQWEDDESGGGGDNPFSSRRRETRRVPNRQRESRGGDWMYGNS